VPACERLLVHDAQAPRSHVSGERARLRAVPRAEVVRRPAWSILAWAIAVSMAVWAIGVLELPVADRRAMDWVGGLDVLAILVLWVRANGPVLVASDAPPGRQGRPRVRLVRSRRPPLPSMNGPDIAPVHRRPRRIGPS